MANGISIVNDVAPANGLSHGHVKTVAGVAVQLTLLGRATRGILIRCPGPNDDTPNTVPVYIGGKTVSPDYAPGTGGLPLCPGESATLPIENPSAVYVNSNFDNQDVAWFAL